MDHANLREEVIFTDKQLCRRWQCSQMKLWRLRQKGILKSTKVGGVGVNLTPASQVIRLEDADDRAA